MIGVGVRRRGEDGRRRGGRALGPSAATMPRTAARRGAARSTASALALLAACIGCGPLPRPSKPSPPPAEAPAARPAPAVEPPGLPTPVHLRSCCAFGQGLMAGGAAPPWPGFESDNIRGVGDLGPHGYDSGLVTLAGDGRRREADEKNGLVYTCRGGFIDVARARDGADMTAFLAGEIETRLESGGAIALPDDGGTRYVLVHAVDPARIDMRAKRTLASDVAGWVAFQVAVWREIVEWYGGGWAGKVAAFSPEDTYSSLFGIGLAKQILRSGEPVVTPEAFERAMNGRLPGALAALGAVPAASARAAMNAVDGRWWDSSRSVADASFVLRRRFDVWGRQLPSLVCEAYRERRCPYRDCGARPLPLTLENPAADGHLDFAGVATLEIEVDATLAARGFPFPRDDSDTVTQAAFPAIVEKLQRADHREAGKNR